MNEVATREEKHLTPIALLAEEARTYSENIAVNMLNLGRVFIEAKEQVPHGNWGEWVSANAGMSVRTAQQLMQCYQRFGSNAHFARLDKSKMYKMLALPEGTEEKFAEEYDLENMTSREVEEAVKRVKAETDALINAQKNALEEERQARRAAEARAAALAERPAEIPPEVAQSLREKDDQIERMRQENIRIADQARDSVFARSTLQKDLNRARGEIAENNEALAELQAENDRLQREILDYQSAAAKGDAERVPSDALTADTFASAVRQFIGVCARMPHMGKTFAAMGNDEHRMYDELLRTMEGWTKDARRALNTYEGGLSDE